MGDRTMLTRTALFGFVLAATLIASARAQDRDYPRKIGSFDGIFCEYKYSLSKLPSSVTDSDKWWKTPHTIRVQKVECNGLDLGVTDEDVELKYRSAVVKTSLIGELTVIVSGDENKNKLESNLKPSQIRKLKRLSWIRVLAAD
jgi:hypothetical protein